MRVQCIGIGLAVEAGRKMMILGFDRRHQLVLRHVAFIHGED